MSLRWQFYSKTLTKLTVSIALVLSIEVSGAAILLKPLDEAPVNRLLLTWVAANSFLSIISTLLVVGKVSASM